VSAALAFVAVCSGVLGIGMLSGRPARRSVVRSADGWAPMRALARLGRTAVRRAAPLELEPRIVAAGSPAGFGVREVMAAKAGGALIATPVGGLLGTLTPGRLGFVAVVATPLAGFFAADLWLARQAAARARAVRNELPRLLDLLRVTVDAGVGLPVALRVVGERGDGPLAREWRAVAAEVALGVPLADALTAMELRLPIAEVGALRRALDRTRRQGVPFGATLSAQAGDARAALARRVREDAARAAPKIQLVVALLLVPSVLLMVAAALIAALASSGGADLSGWA
jgi:tight adherence protein C